MCTSSVSMCRNFCASSTTLASFPSGTPTPPRLSSIRMRNRAILTPDSLHHLAAQTVFHGVGGIFLAGRQTSETSCCELVLAALHGHHNHSPQSDLRIRRRFEQPAGML